MTRVRVNEQIGVRGGKVSTRGLTMRLWLLMILFVCLAGALYLGFGTSGYAEKSAEIANQLEEL